MRISHCRQRLEAPALLALAQTGWAGAAEMQGIHATIGMRSVLEELQAEVRAGERPQARHHLGSCRRLAKRVADGESPDALVAIRGGVDGLVDERQDRGSLRP